MTSNNSAPTNKSRRFGLSKSKITKFEQCPKQLWLATHRPELAAPDEGAEARFRIGNEVGALACALCPNGVMVEAEPDLRAALDTTQELLDSGHPGPIFEATLEHDGVLVRIDVLERDREGGWHLAEVKSSTEPKKYHWGDLATQLWVAREAGLSVSRASIRHINNQFVLDADGHFEGLLTDSDLTETAEEIAVGRAELVREARAVLDGPEPEVAMGKHCSKPFECEFANHCESSSPAGPEWPVTIFPNGGGARWVKQGVEDMLSIEPSALSNENQRRIHQATLTGTPAHDVDGARAIIENWPFPRTWLDFETITFAIPRWIGTRPYQQIPFQFSAHIETEDGEISHREFLSLDSTDPRRECAEALINLLPDSGSVIGYSASFEQCRILELAEAFPDLEAPLRALAARVVDLLPVTRAHWYHRDQRGSWSIKKVLPTIDPSLAYADLEVKDGGNAQAAYLEAIDANCPQDRRQVLDRALRDYCGRDTWAMIAISRHLCGR